MLIKPLIDLGLSEKEAMVYVSLLELEVASVQDIARKSKNNRSTCYVLLDSLIKKGFVQAITNGNVRQYAATSPDTLLHIAKEKASRQNEVEKNIENIVPELKSLYKGTKRKPKVMILEGKDALMLAFEDSLTSKEKWIRTCLRGDVIMALFPDYYPRYLEKRRALGINLKGVYPEDTTVKRYFKSLTDDEEIFLRESEYPFEGDLAIYDNKVGYLSTKNNNTGIIIEDEDMARIMKQLFDLAWEQIKIQEEKKSKKKK